MFVPSLSRRPTPPTTVAASSSLRSSSTTNASTQMQSPRAMKRPRTQTKITNASGPGDIGVAGDNNEVTVEDLKEMRTTLGFTATDEQITQVLNEYGRARTDFDEIVNELCELCTPPESHSLESDSDSEPEWVVEAVVARRRDPVKGTPEFFVKWSGYSSDENTWEPEENLPRVFLRHLYIKTNISPRQARDKHRENSKKTTVFLGCRTQVPPNEARSLPDRAAKSSAQTSGGVHSVE